MAVTVHRFKITGTTSLLMNNPASMVRHKQGVGVKKIPTPEEESGPKAYRLEENGNGLGQLYIPAIALRSSLLGACKGKRFGKVGAATKISAGVFTITNKCPLTDPDTGKPLRDFKINVMRAVVQRQGIMRARPEIEKWQTEIDFEIDDDYVRLEDVLELLQGSGKYPGVLDFRPGRQGPHGRYTVELIV